jgi:ABC-type spermidine/putrescine transport system permease subunit I
MMTRTVLRTRVSPIALVALAPMVVLALLVAGLIWISVQQGIVGTVAARYTFDNYTGLVLDRIFPAVLLNTALFAASTTAVALAIGLSIA